MFIAVCNVLLSDEVQVLVIPDIDKIVKAIIVFRPVSGCAG